ncbi:DUF6916 family protein [Trujillonella humicola]|uniref:DUF6916 family protein n=1 Tax=Trujillonella humicola TaxID=3383699 RepID=UPI0039064B28
MTDVLLEFSAEAFAEAAGAPFAAGTTAGPVPLRLLDVVDSSTARADQFSLVFSGPSAVPLGQGTRRVQHPQLGVFPLFVVPVGSDGDVTLYQAVFNRHRPEASGLLVAS